MLRLHQRYKLNYIYANKITRDLFGLNEQGVAGKTDYDFFKVKTVEQLRKLDNAVLAGKSSKEEITTHDKCNNTKYFIEVKTPIYENEKVIGLLGISTDITEQKELENKVTYFSLTDSLTLLPNRSSACLIRPFILAKRCCSAIRAFNLLLALFKLACMLSRAVNNNPISSG